MEKITYMERYRTTTRTVSGAAKICEPTVQAWRSNRGLFLSISTPEVTQLKISDTASDSKSEVPYEPKRRDIPQNIISVISIVSHISPVSLPPANHNKQPTCDVCLSGWYFKAKRLKAL